MLHHVEYNVNQITIDSLYATIVTDSFLSQYYSDATGFSIIESPLIDRLDVKEIILAEIVFAKKENQISVFKPTQSGRPIYYHINSKGEFYCSTHISMLKKAGVMVEENTDVLPEFFVYRYVSPFSIIGTDVIMHGLSDEDVARAKALFVAFADEKVIETTSYGQIIHKKENGARVYINGVLASDEPNFLFSYNITSITKAMRKRLNRERLNVGRTTYTDRVKAILRVATSQLVKDMLADQVSMRSSGTQCDEMQDCEDFCIL